MQDTEYCISAGEFAKLCKTTRDTLRYYDKMGILVPKKMMKMVITTIVHGRLLHFTL